MRSIHKSPSKRGHRWAAVVGLVFFALIGLTAAGAYFAIGRTWTTTLVLGDMVRPAADEPFPTINQAGLSPAQIKILDILRTEHAKKPANYDQNVLIYTQGNREPWCADFASWVMSRAGAPFNNPNSGSWRIPGVFTLTEYFQAQGRYRPMQEYTPHFGDVAIYNSQQAHDLSNNVHVAIVLSAGNGQLTTLGGNEGGRMRIITRPLKYGENGLVGFGELPAD